MKIGEIEEQWSDRKPKYVRYGKNYSDDRGPFLEDMNQECSCWDRYRCNCGSVEPIDNDLCSALNQLVEQIVIATNSPITVNNITTEPAVYTPVDFSDNKNCRDVNKDQEELKYWNYAKIIDPDKNYMLGERSIVEDSQHFQETGLDSKSVTIYQYRITKRN